jgi:hypothetical protein
MMQPTGGGAVKILDGIRWGEWRQMMKTENKHSKQLLLLSAK